MSNVSMIDGHIDGPKSTDNEVITIDEAIVHCYEVSDRKCDNCGKEHFQLAKWLEELKDSREKINRQKAEIERYKGVIKILENDVATAKSEAIKEFAHLIIDKAENGVIHAMDIPDYVQEMAGEAK